MIYFCHIPKTAGTAIRRLFAETFPGDEIAYIYSPPHGITLQDLWRLPDSAKQKLKAVYGHFPYGLHKTLGQGTYVTCFRETSQRLVSNYLHHVRDGYARDYTLMQYFHEVKPKDMDNYAVRLLSGIGHGVDFGGVTQDHLDRAKENLTRSFRIFGLTEEVEKTASLFIEHLHLTEHAVYRENVTPKELSSSGPPPDEIEAAMRINELDQELYSFARTRFSALYADKPRCSPSEGTAATCGKPAPAGGMSDSASRRPGQTGNAS